MCERSGKEFGLISIPVSDLRVIYAYGVEGRVDAKFVKDGAEKYIDSPILIDRDDYIIDGHHRYLCMRRKGIKETSAIRLDITFEESKAWRRADVSIKEFSRQIGNPSLYEGFKELSKCLK